MAISIRGVGSSGTGLGEASSVLAISCAATSPDGEPSPREPPPAAVSGPDDAAPGSATLNRPASALVEIASDVAGGGMVSGSGEESLKAK